MAWKGTNPADWAKKAERAMLAVKRMSVQDLAEEMTTTIPNGGRVPVKTGNLARSLVVQTGSMPTVKEGGVFASADLGPALMEMDADNTIYLGFQAAYARRMNYGFSGNDSLGRTYNQSGFGFVEAAAAKWPSIVAKNAEIVRNRTGG